MSAPLDELYLKWLYSQVGSIRKRTRSKSYWTLCRQLFTKEFTWSVPNDDNRLADGQELRYEFLIDEELDRVDPDWMKLGCSMLELLIGLSRRLSFQAEGEPRDRFWQLMKNINLDQYNDASDYQPELVDEILDRVIKRTYNSDGQGGLFPLKNSTQDQREIELWYQMSAYVIEEWEDNGFL